MPDKESLFTAVVCIDKPGDETVAARQELLAAHLEFIETIMDQIIVAGPLYDDTGENMVGSLFVFSTGDAATRALLDDDPYFKADFWAEVRINPFMGAAGTAVGGKTW